MRRWLIRVLVVAAIVAAGFVVRATYFAPRPVEVTVIPVERGRVEETVTNSKGGTVRARRRASISSEIGGRVVEIPHREGARVSEGDLLIRLEESSQRAQVRLSERDLDAAEAERERACLAAEQAARELARHETLASRRIISENLLDLARSTAETTAAACRTAEAGVERARAAVEVARTALAKTAVYAPFSGIVAEVVTEVGEYITPSPPGLPIPAVLDLIDPSSIYVSAPMDEVDSARIHQGQHARVTIDSFPGRTFEGLVARVAPYVLNLEAQNRTVEIEVELDDTELASTLLPGTSADVEVILSVREDAIRVPTPTLLEGGVVLLIEDGMLVERPVQIGLRNWDFTEITAGLTAGEEIVSSLDRAEVQPGALAVANAGGTD